MSNSKKLVDILAREMSSWPENDKEYGYCVHCHSSPTVIFGGSAVPLIISGMADDYKTARVMRAEWQAARDALLAAEAAPVWSGEGMPPLGASVEIHSDLEFDRWAHHRGETVTVVAHEKKGGNTIVVYRWADENGIWEYHGLACDVPGLASPFRPVQTPEQIKADERELAARQICADAGSAQCTDQQMKTAYQLYDAGYRKVDN